MIYTDNNDEREGNMNVPVLQGSPRKKGNTAILADEFIRGASEAGHQVEKIDVICFDESGKEGGYVFGFECGAPGDVKERDAMQKACETGKSI